MGKKFDICLMNPPYGKLGEAFFCKAIDISEICCTVQPIAWLIGKKQNKKITLKLDNIGCEIEEINGNKYFDAGLAQTLSINTTNVCKDIIYNGKHYENCAKIKPYSNDKYITNFADCLGDFKVSLWDKIKDTQPYLHRQEKNPNNLWWCIKISKLRGNISVGSKKESDNFYTIISNDDNFIKKIKGQYKDISLIPNKKGGYDFLYFAFDTEDELNNFINYIKTDFVRTCLILSKTNMNMHRGCLSSVPWFDFSQDIFSKTPKEIDDYLFAKYGISEEVRQHISEILPDYYNIR